MTSQEKERLRKKKKKDEGPGACKVITYNLLEPLFTAISLMLSLQIASLFTLCFVLIDLIRMPITLSTFLGHINTKYWLVVVKIGIALVGLIFNITCTCTLDTTSDSSLITQPALAQFYGFYYGNSAKNFTVYSIMIVISLVELYIYESHKKDTENRLLGCKKYGASFYLLFYMALAMFMFDSCVD
jgi:hypothetical protein